jgi:[protein-PII] uridylyltransferase
VVAREVCPRLGLDAAETETVAWLVEHHLLLSFYAFRRDIHDPDTLLRLVATVQSVERLRLLFVLTVVDIKATNPGLLNEWKASLLRDLFNAAEQHLGGGLVVVGRERQVMLAQLPFADGHGRLAETRQQLFTQIPQAYWLSLPAETHARHIPLLEEYQAAGEAIAVSCHPLPARQATEMTVLAPDQTGVFACMAGTMTLARVSIREARIFTLHSGVAFNTFIVESFDGGALWDDQAERVRLRLQAVLQGAFDIVPSLEKGIILPAFDALHPAQVSFDNHTSKTSTILEIRTPDFPGLLYQVASVLWREKIRIDRAKVDTFSRMASDIFYIRNRYGLKIERLEQQQALREMLYQAVFANNKTGA